MPRRPAVILDCVRAVSCDHAIAIRVRSPDALAFVRTPVAALANVRPAGASAAQPACELELPELVVLTLARPLVSITLAQKRLKVSRQDVLNLGELNLREMTGRKRYRAWGIV